MRRKTAQKKTLLTRGLVRLGTTKRRDPEEIKVTVGRERGNIKGGG